MWSGPTPLAGCVTHQFAVCTMDALSVLDATEQTQKCCGGKDPPSGPLLLGGGDTCPKHSLALLSGQADVIGNGNTEIKIQNSYKCHSWRSEWLNPVVQTRWLLPCFVSHPTSQRAADPAVPCGALCAFRSLLGPLRRAERFCSRSCFQCDSRRSCV